MPNDFCVSENVKELIDGIILNHSLDPTEDIKYALASESGDGYTSQAIAATITTSSGIHELFLKCMLCITPTEAMPIDKAFANEILFYDIVYPAYSKFLKDRDVVDGFRDAPKCYGTWQQNIIAMENLKKKGYRLFNCREEIMNEAYITMVLKSFAKFHAISFAFKDQEREKYDKFVEKCHDLLHDEKGNSVIPKLFGGGIKDFLANLDPIEDGEILSRFKFEDLMASVSTSRKTSDYLVLSKGDCWNNNMLFLYEDGNTKNPLDVMLIDWQLLYPASPVFDVSYIFLTAASEEALSKTEGYLKLYYRELSRQIKQLGSNPDILYPFSIFLMEWKKYCKYGFAMGCLAIKVMLCSRDEAFNLAGLDPKDTEQCENPFPKFDNQEEYMKRMKRLARFMIDNSYI
ncbi:hypothetical protein AMK59_829 [Oryctes borbonicus]|uniref:CHK kinase-like domain-containing protein n=1 Tax=Oryctes borbonicus TaxID=1629725 RepID=A0A0T6BB30_9SCAR|nr:hypothetical protein AMK59_829 [Oryctes borbonicus]